MNNGRAIRFSCLIATLLLGSTLLALAADKFRRLGDAAIKSTLSGKEITDDVHWTEQYMRDGSYRAWFMSKATKGTWRTEKGQLCIADGTPDAGCKEVWVSGSKVQFRFKDGRVMDGVLQKQHP